MIRNREAAGIQITSEQLVHEARTQFGDLSQQSKVRSEYDVADKEELSSFLQRKRKDFEDRLRRHRHTPRVYLDYAHFEASRDDYGRARSVFERGLMAVPGDCNVWITYAEMEVKGGFMNHALNVLDRAVGILPKRNEVWFKYVLYSEAARKQEAREVFERWMQWEPESEEPWFAYAQFEERYGELGRARDVYERFCGAHPTTRAYGKFAKWEDAHGKISNARLVYERAAGADGKMSELPQEELAQPEFWLAFAAFESKRGETDRARALYEFALTKVSPENRGRIYAEFASFEKRLKRHDGDSAADSIVISRRREEYEVAVKENPKDYDAWFDLCRMEESLGDFERTRNAYARAEANPPGQDAMEKRSWRRFVFFFIYESAFEELVAKDIPRARAALRRGLDCVPHKFFTFSKLWILATQLELRCKDLNASRKLLGTAIGLCPKDKTFRYYIQLELQLGQVERCRVLYEKYLLWGPTNAQAWAKYAELEKTVGEEKRARALFELGVAQSILDQPEKLWLRYIDFEAGSSDEEAAEETTRPVSRTADERVKALYERLVERTEKRSSKVWIAYAKFLAFSGQFGPVKAEEVLEDAEAFFKRSAVGADESAMQDERSAICIARAELERRVLEIMEDEEAKAATEDALRKAFARIPKKVERTSPETGETKVEWLFPADVLEEAQRQAKDEERSKKTATLKLLEMAQKWKKQKLEAGGVGDLDQ